MNYKDLGYFKSGEWQVVEERLKDLKGKYCPGKANLFKCFELTPLDETKVAFIGQDPYPNPTNAMGLAFSVPPGTHPFPQTLQTIFKEYCRDLHYEMPKDGDLTKWAKQGVLLYNAYPSCGIGKSMSHRWSEWEILTKELIKYLSAKGVVFVFVGAEARKYITEDLYENSDVIVTSHPSPRGQLNTRMPFVGSRLFTTINEKLKSVGETPIDWNLD